MHLIALESLAARSCIDQKRFKSLPQVLRLSPADTNIDDEITIVFDRSNSRHLGPHPGKYRAAAAPSKSKVVQCHAKAYPYLLTIYLPGSPIKLDSLFIEAFCPVAAIQVSANKL